MPPKKYLFLFKVTPLVCFHPPCQTSSSHSPQNTLLANSIVFCQMMQCSLQVFPNYLMIITTSIYRMFFHNFSSMVIVYFLAPCFIVGQICDGIKQCITITTIRPKCVFHDSIYDWVVSCLRHPSLHDYLVVKDTLYF